MPSIDVSEETYAELKRRAARSGRTVEQEVDAAFGGARDSRRQELARAWRRGAEEVDAKRLGWSEEEVEERVQDAIDEVRAEPRAGGH